MEPLTIKDYKDLTIEQAEKVAEALQADEDPYEWDYVCKDEQVIGRGEIVGRFFIADERKE